MDQTQRPRYVSRFEPLALHPRLHHRVGFPIHYLPPREPPPRRICYNTRSTELLSQTPTSTEAKQQPTPLPKRVIQTKLHLSLEGANNNQLHLSLEGVNHNLNLYQRGSNPIKARVYNKWLQRPQTNSLFHKTRS